MPIGEVFVSASVQVLVEKLASSAMSELGKLYGVKDELAKLKKTLKRLHAILLDAEQKKKAEGRQHTLWLRELNKAFYDAENVVEEFDYEDLRRKVENSSTSEGRNHGACCKSLSSASGKLSKLCSCLSPQAIYFHYKMARKIDNIRRRLDEIAKEKKDFDAGGMAVIEGKQPEFQGPTQTSALLGDLQVFGREEVKNKLIEWLLATDVESTPSSSSSSLSVHPRSFSVLSIFGMGGLGKTTLAKLVYNTEQVQEHFHLRFWVFVSLDFNLQKLTKQILDHFVDTQPNLQNTDNLNVLQQSLSDRLKGKRFLLILDDVWEENPNKWKEFSGPLAQGAKGSKLLITTRNTNVADILRPEKIELNSLSFDDSWSIFKKHAFTDVNSDKHPILEPIGKIIIVEKLKGIPLAIATIGGLLGSESDEGKWREVLQNELWEIQQGGEGILPALKLSYEYLPTHLKPCFTYCSLVPKGCKLDMLELVQLWMAQGYIQPQGKKSVEDVGKDSVKELFTRSLVQFVDGKYVLHDLLHDLGRNILEHDCSMVRLDQGQKIPEKDADSKIHLTVGYLKPHEGMMEVLSEFKSLRTLSFWFSGYPYIQVPHELFHTVKYLRVLDLSFCSLDTLPDSIGCLIHLKYIDLRKTNIECLPDSFCTLYNLQTLKLEGCKKLKILPSGMSNLINLHYIEAESKLVSKIAKIGRLTHLQYLQVFSISEENKNRIGDLKDMKELRGRLCIQNLQRVQTRQEAMKAALRNMQYLEALEMQWADGQGINQTSNYPLEYSIIDGQWAPPNLRELTVKFYPGINFTGWMNSSSPLSSLESLHLDTCINLDSFSSLRQLSPLRTLEISCCSKLKELSQFPPALENLTLREVGLVELPHSLCCLPLQQLVICQTFELKELPPLPATLKKLTIEGVGLHALPRFCQDNELSAATTTSEADDDEHKSSNSTTRKPILSTLEIHDCAHLTTLDEGLLKQHHLKHLRVLSIKNCEELVNWPEGEGFQSTLLCLHEELSIVRCPKLKTLPEGSALHPSLKKLVVKDCVLVPNKLIFSQLHNVDDVVLVHNIYYRNLAHCADEALRHILAVDCLQIVYLECPQPSSSSPLVSLVYDRIETFGVHMDEYMARRVVLTIHGGRRGGHQQSEAIEADDGVTLVLDDDHHDMSSCSTILLRMCPEGGGLPWTSSLRSLTFRGIPDRALMFGNLIHPPLRLSSLERLAFLNCKEMRRLPTTKFLSHLTALKMMSIDDCPELT